MKIIVEMVRSSLFFTNLGSRIITEGSSESETDPGEKDTFTPAVDLPPPSSVDSEDSRSYLQTFGIQVDPLYRLVVCIEPGCQKIFKYQSIYPHKQRSHYRNTNRTLQTRLPPASKILSAIENLGGFNPSPPNPRDGPIDPIAGVEITNGTKCTIGECTGHVYGNTESLRTHQSSFHPTVKSKKRSSVTVKCQSLNAVREFRSYIEVHPLISTTQLPQSFEIIMKSADLCNLLKQDDVFTLASSEQEKGAVFAQTHWDELIDGVNTEKLIQTACTSFHFTNPSFLVLRDYVREYYQEIVPTLDAIPLIARRYLLTSKIKYVVSPFSVPNTDMPHSEPLKNQPFRRPQEYGRTVDRDADNITRFISFLILHLQHPVENFPINLHPDVRSLLLRLYDDLGQQNPDASKCKALIHETVWAVLEKPSTQFLEDDRFCPFTRFLVAAHLKPHGQFVRANAISPFIGYVQWSLRATTAKKLMSMVEQFGGDYLA